MLDITKMPRDVLTKFVERFGVVPAVDPRFRDPQRVSSEMVAESLITWITDRSPEHVEEFLFSRVMQDNLFYKMGELYVQRARARKNGRITDAVYEKAGLAFTRDVLAFMEENMPPSEK